MRPGATFVRIYLMERKPLTRIEAEQLSLAYQYLQGQLFDHDDGSIIQCVTIAPFDPINKLIFLYEYRDSANPEEALEFYCGFDFDVIIVAKIEGKQPSLAYRELAAYLNDADHITDTPALLEK
jgi:hypothetical protein